MKITKGQLKQIIRESYDDIDGYDPMYTSFHTANSVKAANDAIGAAIDAVEAAKRAIRKAGSEAGKMLDHENEGERIYRIISNMATKLMDKGNELNDMRMSLKDLENMLENME